MNCCEVRDDGLTRPDQQAVGVNNEVTCSDIFHVLCILMQQICYPTHLNLLLEVESVLVISKTTHHILSPSDLIIETLIDLTDGGGPF